MRDYVQQQDAAAEHGAWFRRQVQIGIDSADAGNLIPAAEVPPPAKSDLPRTHIVHAPYGTGSTRHSGEGRNQGCGE